MAWNLTSAQPFCDKLHVNDDSKSQIFQPRPLSDFQEIASQSTSKLDNGFFLGETWAADAAP
jgi:hypothetical protein